MKQITLKNEYQELTILTTGATIHEWKCFREQRNILISNKNLDDYKKTNMGYFNQTIGRVANRIKHGKFTLNDTKYQLSKNFDGIHHGHGGPNGFNIKEFDIIEQTKNHVHLQYISPDMEEGYPGELTLSVIYTLSANTFKIDYHATTTKDTIVNITNHAHFNLSDEPTILNHLVSVSADRILEIDDKLIPTGKHINATNTSFDLREPKLLKDVILNENVQNITKGLDHAFLFGKKHEMHLKYQNKNLRITTSYPGVQIYTMNHPFKQELLNDRPSCIYAGIAFEPQYEPNAINTPSFNQPLLRAGDEYNHEIIYEIFED